MKIAAQLNGSILKIFVEDTTWKKILQPFNKEQIKVERLVYVVRNKHIFHDAISKSKPDTHPTLMFCRKKLTVWMLKQQIKRAGYGEPYEMRLAWPNKLNTLDKVFPGAYTLTFRDYKVNTTFATWLESIETLEASFLLQRLQVSGRYHSRDSKFRAYDTIDEFIWQSSEQWQREKVKEFEAALAKGTVTCPSCDLEKGI